MGDMITDAEVDELKAYIAKGVAQDADCILIETPAITALIARLDAAEGGWQPIETAPKDGTTVLLARFDGLDGDLEPDALVAGHWAHWADHRGWYLRGFGTLTDTGAYFDGSGELSDNGWAELRPTHWMPLPKAPSPPSRREG